ncbi:MAG: KH domain-containing protein, partial [Proteobacteria bacterium]|nr:KH domain-containing protein [Pseudomonadota bacterium]MBU1450320.1 KH domain-containing protein [Pseudomonadota bacterium]MBU2467191.1 KH domain-containing protein [Pseudomonadota bacterium]
PEVKAAVHPPARPTPAAPPAPREAIAPANQSSEVAPGAPPPTAAPETHPAEAAHDQAELLEFGREVLERLAQALDSNASVEAIKGEHGPGLSIMGADSGIVIGRRGQTLDALQYLTTRIVSHKYGKAVHLIVDSGGYRQRRRSALEEAARRMADKARSSRRPQSIGPLNSQERRLVHVVLRSQRGISTVSRGKGELKKVVITPR